MSVSVSVSVRERERERKKQRKTERGRDRDREKERKEREERVLCARMFTCSCAKYEVCSDVCICSHAHARNSILYLKSQPDAIMLLNVINMFFF